MVTDLHFSNLTISAVIQIAVAPVFLLAGIAALLGVMTTRLGRIIDRSRRLHSSNRSNLTPAQIALFEKELASLEVRGRFINLAITFATSSALMVCVVIITIFVSQFLNTNLGEVIAGLFVLCMLALIIALVMFLREVAAAASAMREGLVLAERFVAKSDG